MLKNLNKVKQKGQAIIIAALGLVGVAGMGAIVVDVGSVYVQASQFQNVTDAAALAGVANYVDNSKTRLIHDSQDIAYNKSFDYSIKGTSYSFSPVANKTTADNKAETYVDKNTDKNVTIKANGNSGLWSAPVTATLVDKSKAHYADIYCYKVDVTVPVNLTFARLFGLETWDVTVSSVALALPTEYTEPTDDQIEDFLKEINANIYKTAPNYYWETIFNSTSESVSSDASYVIDYVSAETGLQETMSGEIYGKQSSKYFSSSIMDYVVAANGLASTMPLKNDPFLPKGTFSDLPAGTKYSYGDSIVPVAWKRGSDPYCAEPIFGVDKINGVLGSQLLSLVYPITRKFIQEQSLDGGESKTIFVDRPNTQSGGYGAFFRSIIIQITGDTLNANSEDEKVPLYLRVESEPMSVVGQLTLVTPFSVDVQGDQNKPIIVAYDGPERYRGQVVSETPDIDSNSGAPYKWTADKYGNPVWAKIMASSSADNYKNYYLFPGKTVDTGKDNTPASGYGKTNNFAAYNYNHDYLLHTSDTVSAPITINLTHDFKGVIYAPFSKIILQGSGKIDGFVMAAEVVDKGGRSSRTSRTVHATLPTWYATPVASSSHNASDHGWFKYTVENVTGDYTVVYDDFCNYTFTDLDD